MAIVLEANYAKKLGCRTSAHCGAGFRHPQGNPVELERSTSSVSNLAEKSHNLKEGDPSSQSRVPISSPPHLRHRARHLGAIKALCQQW